ncbi:MAG: hypothetical protein L6R37_000830 [Teloschistes peruensis]|nr:MAG: hypothetical protein L6R37_000830 [Teloschistes peruensis]
MTSSNPSSTDPSRAPTPSNNSTSTSRFTSQAATAEDLLKSQTVGLVHLTDFRKRRAEALEQKEREAHGGNFGRFTSASGTGTPSSNDGITASKQPLKKKRKPATKGKLSFGVDDDEEAESNTTSITATQKSATPDAEPSRIASPSHSTEPATEKKRLGPNATIPYTPKALTKSALLRETQTRELLRKKFLAVQEAVKATDIVIPFVFYDGTNIPGGTCRVKKGDFVWLFLDRSRKVGAELGVAGGDKSSRREWARVGVDDLMMVRGEVIIPHHYDFYYFIVNKTLGHSSIPLFDYASTTTTTSTPSITNTNLSPSNPPHSSRSPSPEPSSPSYNPLTHHPSKPLPKNPTTTNTTIPSDPTNLEGATTDPTFTKVVDRRWYERNKHIFPASVWEEFDPGRDYSKGMRRDGEGNAFFFS